MTLQPVDFSRGRAVWHVRNSRLKYCERRERTEARVNRL